MSFYWNKCYKYTQKSDNIKAIYKVGKKFIYKLDCILGRLKLIKTNKKRNICCKKDSNFVYLLEIHCIYDFRELTEQNRLNN